MNTMCHEEPPAAYDVDECTICHDGFKSNADKSFLCCAHYFHKDCIDKWLAGHDSCPICNTIAKENSFPADANFAYDGDHPEGADDAIDFNRRFGYFLPTDTAAIRNLMQQAANRVQQMGIHLEHNMLCYVILIIICIALPSMQQWGQQWRQNVPYNGQQLGHNVQKLGEHIKNNAKQLEHNVQKLGEHIQNNAKQLEHNVQKLGESIQNNAKQLEHNVQKLGERIENNVQQLAHNLQQVQQNVVQRLQQRMQKLLQQLYRK